MMRIGPVRKPVVETSAPTIPARFCPRKVDTFSAMMPGVHWPMEK